MSFTCLGFKNNIITFNMDGKEIINPFEVAIQAMIGKHVYDVYKSGNELNLIPRYYALKKLKKCDNDFYANEAIRWLEEKAKKDPDKYTWMYEYDIIYNNELIKAPWVSAFGQSYVILAFMHWYRQTKEEQYKEYAIKGIQGLVEPIQQGGTLLDKGGFFWFEEIPNQQSTHILNAHLISVLTLLEAKNILPEYDCDIYIHNAVNSLIRNIGYYDSGLYSNYEINKKINKVLQLKLNKNQKTLIRSIRLYEQGKCIKQIQMSKPDAFDNQKRFFVSGIDWGQSDKEGYRELINGYKLRKKAVEGGQRQNTYLCFNNLEVSGDEIELELEYKTVKDNRLELYVQNNRGYMKFLKRSLDLKSSMTKTKIKIPVRILNPYLSEVYHRYHILLLSEINMHIKRRELRDIIMRFKGYTRKNNWMIGG